MWLFATITNTSSFTRTNSAQSLAGANRDVMQAMDFLIASFFGWEKSHLLCENNSVWKIVNDGLT